MHAQGWDLGWNPAGQTIFFLSALGLFPGLAAWVAVGALPIDPLPIMIGKAGRGRYLAAAFTLLPFVGALAAAISVLVQWAAWDLTLQTLHHELFLRLGKTALPLPLTPPPVWAVWLFSFFISPWLFLPLAWVEETGWRGFGYAWLRPRGFWTTALGLGVLSWAWRLPLLIWGYPYPGHPWLGPLVGLGFQLGFSVTATWLREKSGGLLAPALARSTLFGAALIPLSLTVDYDPLLAHLQGVIGVGLMGLLALFGAVTGWFSQDADSADLHL